MSAKRPNILLIMSDEHDPAVIGCYGDPIVQTPNLDRLASRGVTFDACYCNSPLCVPSRLSVTASQYVSRFDGWSNSEQLPSDDDPSVPQALRSVGYDPVLCGKQHYGPTHRYGFRDALPLLPQNREPKQPGPAPRRRPDAPNNVNKWLPRATEFRVGNRSDILDTDRVVTANAVQILDRWRDLEGDTPLFLFAGFVAPHFPMIVPEPWASMYTGKVPPPHRSDEQIARLPTNYVQHRRGFGNVDADPAVEQRGRELYGSLVSWFDAQVGQVLDALEASGIADDTIVIYTSDHGENKGDHGLWWKNCVYDHGARVPLIVSWPKRWAGGQRRTGVCSLVDVMQTVMQLAGAPPHPDMDGDSLVPWLDDPAAAWKDRAICEYYGHFICSGITMLRQGRWKYVDHARIDGAHGPERELYDMQADPHEMHNLADDSQHAARLEAMHAAMVDELGEDPESIEPRARRGPLVENA